MFNFPINTDPVLTFSDEAAYVRVKVKVVVFPVASWDVCPVCIGDDRIELCY